MVIRDLDARVHDRVALNEIEMYGNLIIAAIESHGLLTQQIDEILGLHVHDEQPRESARI